MFCVMLGRMIFSSVFAIGDSRDMGLYDVPFAAGLFGLRIGTILASFQICGIVFVFSELLYSFVRYVVASGPRCFRCFMLMLSAPVELLFLLALIAAVTCSGVIAM